jgi:uncharacterized cysteine cluster protein YcgN (CxxCxxCC family)
LTRFWETTPIEQLDRGQWEALCDGCGKCCIHKLEDEDTGAAGNVRTIATGMPMSPNACG